MSRKAKIVAAIVLCFLVGIGVFISVRNEARNRASYEGFLKSSRRGGWYGKTKITYEEYRGMVADGVIRVSWGYQNNDSR